MVLINHRNQGHVYSKGWCRRLIILGVFLGLVGCSAKSQNKNDPFEGFNRGVYKFNRTVDSMYIKPTSYIYKNVIPPPVRGSVANFIYNLEDIPTTINQVLQGNIKKAGNNLGRLVVNSTLGIFGFFDVATPMGLTRHHEDFGQTLSVWGYTKSPYLVLPILGPSTVRDGVGIIGNTFMSLPYYWDEKWRNTYFASYMINKRAELEDIDNLVSVAGVDEYTFVRNSYLQKRDYETSNTIENNGDTSDLLDEPPE